MNQIKHNGLKQFINFIVNESRQQSDYITTLSGDQVQFGTQEHIDDIDSTVANLSRFRDAQRRTSASRATYAAAIRELKKEKAAAQRHGQKQGYLDNQYMQLANEKAYDDAVMDMP